MKVVGLLSGGKDSCYNLLHCVQQGHELVALATLSPPPGESDELDSYMYQTVGHDAVHLVAAALDLPLYRRTITGTALNQSSEYRLHSPSDETEDLYNLLLTVKSAHPEIDAVSVGAILSNYQRVRVEHVALRPELNLTPLTYLWQRDQSELYREMLESGQVSILIKVAGIGLGEGDLGKTLGQMQGKLERLSAMYGAHVCGEGGEYETLTVDSPLFRKRLDVRETETVVHSDSAFGSVSYLRLRNARLVEKEEREGKWEVKTPPLLDKVGRRALRAAKAAATETLSDRVAQLSLSEEALREIQLPPASIRQKGRYVVLSNVTGHNPSDPTPLAVEDQVKSAFSTISSLLSPIGLDLTSISHINLYLRSQSSFSAVNGVYRTLFGVSPPTRACVALPNLPTDCDVVINAIAFSSTSPPSAHPFDRRALHVQGRSFWAPANIGPYSQSLVVGEKIWVAGQIGLVPADLTLPGGEEGERLQTVLSLQHARRIFKATLGDMGGRGVDRGWVDGGVCWVQQGQDLGVVESVWRSQLEDGEEEEGEEGESWLGQTQGGEGPPMLFVTLPKGALPRGAAVEWQVTAHTGRVPPPLVDQGEGSAAKTGNDDEDEEDDAVGSDATDVKVTRTHATLAHDGGCFEIVHTVTASSAAQSRFGILTLRRLSSAQPSTEDEASELASSLQALVDRAYSVQLFHPPTSSTSNDALSLLATLIPPDLLNSTQNVPCLTLHTPSLTPVELALIYHGI